jgi:hypothetical protein
MKLPVIKQLTEVYSVDELHSAEEAILNEETPSISIDGEDEGEQLTHCMAAIWIKTEMQKNNLDFRSAMRAYTNRVRKSIS